MYAIISVLDPESCQIVNEIWHQLCEACGLKAIYDLPTPHFTWLLADALDVRQTEPILSGIVSNAKQMTLHTFGIGLFTGENPVLYLPLVKSREMINLHEAIWEQIAPFSAGAKLYYSPRLWVPHITLALNDLTRDNLACAVSKIAFEQIELFVQVNNLAIVKQENDQPGETLSKFCLVGNEVC